MKKLTYLLKEIIKIIIKLLVILIKLFFKKKNTVLIQCYDDNRYCDNTRYLFEYISNQNYKNFKIYWTTENTKIQSYLKKKNLKYLSIKSNILLYLYCYTTAKIIINPGSNIIDKHNLLTLDTIKITTSHGAGPKLTTTRTDDIYNEVKEINEINNFNYINFTADFISKESGIKKFQIPEHKIIQLGFPRCDQFFNIKLTKEKYLKKNIAKSLVGKINSDSKIIYYTPTWRPYDYSFPLNQMLDFNYSEFDNFLSRRNIFFFYTLHSERRLSDIPQNLTNIKIINTQKNPLFDTNLFMNETDILINDYSTTSTDYCLLSKPQIFFMPDFELYNSNKGFLEDYKNIIPGKEIKKYNDFIELIDVYLKYPKQYNIDYDHKINKYLNNYYNIENKESSKKYLNFIGKII